MKTIYENDVVTLDDYEDACYEPPIEEMLHAKELEVKRFARKDKKVKREEKKKIALDKAAESPIYVKLSTIAVKSHCNKCKEIIYGDLLNMIWHPENNLMNPFFSYSCEKCGHVGKRSDYSQALEKDLFLKHYKIDD